jgi:hypothetical protein
LARLARGLTSGPALAVIVLVSVRSVPPRGLLAGLRAPLLAGLLARLLTGLLAALGVAPVLLSSALGRHVVPAGAAGPRAGLLATLALAALSAFTRLVTLTTVTTLATVAPTLPRSLRIALILAHAVSP